MKRSKNLPTLLLATNDPDSSHLEATLQDAGFSVHYTGDGARILKLYRRYLPAIVVIEMDMPQADSMSVCREIRAQNQATTIIVIIPQHDHDLIDMALEAGANDCIAYPIHPQLLVNRIQTLYHGTLNRLIYQQAGEQELEESLFLCDQSDTFILLNPSACHLLDYSENELLKMSYLEIIPPIMRDQLHTTIRRLRIGETYHYRSYIITKFDMEIPVEIVFSRLENSLIFGVLRDLRRVQHAEASWKNAEERYRKFFDAVNDAIMIVDMDSGYLLDVNQNTVEWLGYSRPELLETRFSKIQVSLRQSMNVEDETDTLLASTGRMIFQVGLRRKDGTILPVELSTRLVDFDGRQAAINLARDITERLEIERQEREHRLLAESLKEIAAVLNSSLERKEVLDHILSSVEALVNADSINVMVLEGEQAIAIGRKNRSEDLPTDEERTRGFDIQETATLSWIYNHRKSLLIHDVRTFEGWIIKDSEDWIRSYAGVPILQDDEVIGFVNLDGSDVGQFNEEQVVYLEAFAHQAGIALKNARLHESLQERAQKLEHHVAERTKQLQKERNLLRTILDNLPDEIYVKDIDGYFMLANHALITRLQKRYGIQSIEGMTDADFASPKQVEAWRQDEERIIATRKPLFNQEILGVDNEGKKISLLATKAPLIDTEGHVSGIVGINHDITELRETEASLNQIVASVNCLLWEADATYQNRKYHYDLKVSNETAAAHFFPLETQNGESYTTAFKRSILQPDAIRIDQTLKAALSQNYANYSDEFRFIDAEGKTRWLRQDVNIHMLHQGHWQLAGICVETTEQKQAMEALEAIRAQLEERVEERTRALSQANKELKAEIAMRTKLENARRESEARFRALVEHAPEAIVVFDFETDHFVDVNENAVKLFGLERDDLMTKRYIDMSPELQPDGSLSRTIMRTKIRDAIKGNNDPFEWTHLRQDGTTVPCEVRLLLLPTSGTSLIRGSITDITYRKETEAALLESEAKYRTLTNQLPIGVYRTTWDGRLLYANNALSRIFGYGQNEFLEEVNVKALFASPEEREALLANYSQDHDADKPREDEYDLYTRDGRKIRVRDTWHIIYDEDGDIAYIDGTLVDITEQTRIRQLEHEQRIFTQALSDAASDLNRSLEFNDVLNRILSHIQRVLPPFEGVSIMLLENENEVHVIRYQQVKDGMLTDLVPQYTPYGIDMIPNLVYMRDHAEPIVISDTHYSDRWIRREDITDWIRSYVAAPIMSDDEVIGFLNVSSGTPNLFIDVHGERLFAFANQVGIAIRNARTYSDIQSRVEEQTIELRQQSSQLKAILDGMSEGVIYYDAHRNPIYTNRYLSDLTGYTEQELRERDALLSLLQMDAETLQRMLDKVDEALLNSGSWNGILKMQNRAGDEIDLSWKMNLIRDDAGKPFGSVSVIRDISKERQLERQRSNFIAQASHELRTPLANMKTRIYLLRHQPHKMDEHIEVLKAVTQRMSHLVDDLLEISKSEHGMTVIKRSVAKIQDIIQDVVKYQSILAERKNITIIRELPETPIYVSVDVQRIERVFINLLANAVNYTDEGGLIKFDIEQRDDRVGILVHDTGIGIPADVLPHVFKPFVRGTDQRKGSGLGLSIVKEIIESHGGTIEVESEVGVGTTFTVWIETVSPNGD